MKKKLIEHLLSISFVSLIFLILIINIKVDRQQSQTQKNRVVESYLKLDFLDFDNPLHKALLLETMDIYYPESKAWNDSLIKAIDKYRAEQIANLARRANLQKGLTWDKLTELSGMYFKFIFAYIVVMLLTYYGVQTLAIVRFVKMKQNQTSYLAEIVKFIHKTTFPRNALPAVKYFGHSFQLLGKAVLKGISYLILFAPAYVIAYSLRTNINTDTFFFMIVLGVVSNGLLITYSQKFYTFLVAESRKGYMQTAIIKGLNHSYSQQDARGIPWKLILRFGKKFPGHVFQHIYINARYQYLSTIKEQASFLITGLIIIEMALNIHGHLCYEMLQNILYKQFDVVLTIMLGIFLVVKATEIYTDYWQYVESQQYENM